MWVGSVLATVSSVVAQAVSGYQHVHTCTHFTCTADNTSAGLGGYWANVIQFGLDQLQDASTTEITAFISWFMWTYMSGGIVIDFAYTCILGPEVSGNRAALCMYLSDYGASICHFYQTMCLSRNQ